MNAWSYRDPDGMPAYLREAPSLTALGAELEAVAPRALVRGGSLRGRLYSYGNPASPALLLLPPTGMSFLLLSRLGLALSSDFHVIVKESKGCPDWEVEIDDGDFEVESQSEELAGIVDEIGVEEVHLVGWCQAAQTIVRACRDGRIEPRTISLLAPAGLGYAVVGSEFERCALPIYRQIADKDDPDYARRMSQVLEMPSSHEDAVESLPERLSLLHLANSAATLRFSRYMRAFENAKARIKPEVVPALSVAPTCLIHARDDVFSHYSESVQVARAVPGAELKLFREGGHLMMFKQAEHIAELIRGFVLAHSARKGG